MCANLNPVIPTARDAISSRQYLMSHLLDFLGRQLYHTKVMQSTHKQSSDNKLDKIVEYLATFLVGIKL